MQTRYVGTCEGASWKEKNQDQVGLPFEEGRRREGDQAKSQIYCERIFVNSWDRLHRAVLPSSKVLYSPPAAGPFGPLGTVQVLDRFEE